MEGGVIVAQNVLRLMRMIPYILRDMFGLCTKTFYFLLFIRNFTAYIAKKHYISQQIVKTIRNLYLAFLNLRIHCQCFKNYTPHFDSYVFFKFN